MAKKKAAAAEPIVWRGNPRLAAFLVPIGELVEDPANARRHDERSIEVIGGSLARFAQQTPIVVGPGRVVRKGNGTLRAALARGWTHVAALESDLAGPELDAYALADNRTAEVSTWDYEALAGILKGLQAIETPIEDLGWQAFELEPLLAAVWIPAAIEELPGRDEAAGQPLGHDGPDMGLWVTLTAQQRIVFNRAVAALRETEADPEIAEGRCLELICADFLSGA